MTLYSVTNTPGFSVDRLLQWSINVRVTEYTVGYRNYQIETLSSRYHSRVADWTFGKLKYETNPNSPPPRLLLRLPHALLGIFLVDHRQIFAILRDIRSTKKQLFALLCRICANPIPCEVIYRALLDYRDSPHPWGTFSRLLVCSRARVVASKILYWSRHALPRRICLSHHSARVSA